MRKLLILIIFNKVGKVRITELSGANVSKIIGVISSELY